jgi:hypothetical protein
MRSGFDAMTIADAIYALCAGTSLLAAWLLFRHYTARRTPLLLWSCVAFIGLALNNVLVLLDFGLFPDANLALPRALAGALAMLTLTYGLVRETAR